MKIQNGMKLVRNYSITVVGFLIGFFILHPLTMVLGHVMHITKTKDTNLESELISEEIIASFSLQMLPWGILIGLLCGIIGYYFESLQKQKRLLKNANDTKDRFFSIIAHDLKTPFFTLVGYSELLLRKYDEFDDESRIKYIRVIENAAERTHDLLENLLEWARIQSENIELFPIKINTKDLISESIALHQDHATKKQLSFQILIPNDTYIVGDLNMISMVFRNLLTNAIKYSHEKGSVEISSNLVDRYENIIVADSGIGMTEEEISDLFRIDTKSSKLGTAGEKGTGLGLILCQEFMKRHKGKIFVESQEGKGTQFVVQLPGFKGDN